MMPKRKGEAPQNPSGPVVEIIVRRGALRRFDRLQKTVTHLPVKLSWDRRLRERRESSRGLEREPRYDRRKTPPFTWEVADFLVVEMPTQYESA
jgi:hypothetical protein